MELKEIEVDEISLVKKAANAKRYLLVKSKGGDVMEMKDVMAKLSPEEAAFMQAEMDKLHAKIEELKKPPVEAPKASDAELEKAAKKVELAKASDKEELSKSINLLIAPVSEAITVLRADLQKSVESVVALNTVLEEIKKDMVTAEDLEVIFAAKKE